ncbi:amidohydrolase 2 [Lindgomyces ingoldianus]|uniref:Amidohydrolase 2 n=1 Tax=Lindgomyces ingoldianus TaxID=673940 RepID=A0ACB6RAI2_9PLEO|nr:amidohydrolase 2 [Lindgomyces ingoldianus]KAF2476293.1 amidohydrolase 2 [Lindgomyces ingoldianus]
MAESAHIARIKKNAKRDNIDLTVLPFLASALADIQKIFTQTISGVPTFSNATRIDTHVHPVPSWFHDLQPLAGGRETPSWDILSHFNFMLSHSITRSILCISTPQANAFPGDKPKTRALARILNEFTSALVTVYPDRFSFLAVTALPYVEESIAEVRYALNELGAVGVGVLTNHEALYPGDKMFRPLWEYLQNRSSEREIIFIHPTDPLMKVDGRLVDSKPSPLRSGLGEFYFETARAISSITASRTIIEFPKLHWRISHGAGAFPDIEDRFLLGVPMDAEEAWKIYATRAGPVYPRQIKGLLAHDVPVSQFVFGTDYPYGIGFWDVDANIAGLADADFLSPEEKDGIFHGNARELWKGKIGGV